MDAPPTAWMPPKAGISPTEEMKNNNRNAININNLSCYHQTIIYCRRILAAHFSANKHTFQDLLTDNSSKILHISVNFRKRKMAFSEINERVNLLVERSFGADPLTVSKFRAMTSQLEGSYPFTYISWGLPTSTDNALIYNNLFNLGQ
jgi:hypothetical protein